jgi:hypothetical protein
MSGKVKHRKDRLIDFLRYLQNKMKDRERNSFERNLQRDPFAEEAMEGLERIGPVKAEEDYLQLKKRLKSITSGKRKISWYQIAASAAVLMLISSIIIIQVRNQPQEQLSYAPPPEPQEGIIERPAPIREPEIIHDGVPATRVMVPDREKQKIIESPEEELISDRAEVVAETKVEADEAGAVRRAEIRKAENIRTDAPVSKSALAKRTATVFTGIRGKIISSEDNQPLPGVSIIIKGTDKGTVTDTNGSFSLSSAEVRGKTLVASFVGMVSQEFSVVGDSSLEIKLEPSAMALSEVVVVGYGIAGGETTGNAAGTAYTPPRPLTGRADFEKYIRENMKRPDSASAGQRVVVVAGFIVRKNGETDSIRIIRSPAEIFSNEAIRLIREGPAWKPGEQDGKPVDDEVRVRIVFK